MVESAKNHSIGEVQRNAERVKRKGKLLLTWGWGMDQEWFFRGGGIFARFSSRRRLKPKGWKTGHFLVTSHKAERLKLIFLLFYCSN